MNAVYSLPVLILFLSLTACTVKPQPIAYGTDACHYCSMTIVDRQHAAEFVTDKGKAFKFDSIECMMNGLKDSNASEVATFLVNDYKVPGELIDATQATFLISPQIPSPMGEFLSAFETREKAEIVQVEQGGDLYNWQELKERFR